MKATALPCATASPIRNWMVILLVIWSLVPPALSQNDTADLRGTVVDESGAVLPNAKVSVTNIATALRRDVRTDSSGGFSIPALLPGKYTLRTEHEGFSITESQHLTLNVGDNRAVQVRLKVGGANEVVTVSAEGQLVNNSGALSSLTTERELQDLPSVSREFGDQRTQAFVLSNPGTTDSRGGWISVNGGRNLDNTPTVDGMIVTSHIDSGGGSVVQSGMEGTQQVSIELAGAPAEFPRPSQYSTITKGGTKDFHGSAFYNYNGSFLNAKDYFANRVPARVYNDGGISIGGPAQKNKTFFFVDWEHSRESVAVVIAGNTPLVPWRRGDFSGISQRIINPYTNLLFQNNQIPTNLISAVSKNVQNLYYPLPNFGSPRLEAGNYRSLLKPGQSGLTAFDSFDARVDHQFGTNDHTYASFNFINMPLRSWQTGSLPPFGLRHSFRLARSGQVSWTHISSQSLVNELRVGYTRQKNSIRSTFVGSAILNQVGIQGVSTVGIPTVPIIQVSGLTTARQIPYFFFPDTSFQWTDNLTWTKAAHTLRFGFTVVHDQNTNLSADGSAYGQYRFSGAFTGFPYADFLLGLPQTTELRSLTPENHRFGNWWNAYVQDQWKLSHKLTLNYGLRWEAQGPYYEKHDLLSNFDPTTGSIVVPDGAISQVNSLYPKNLPIESASVARYPSRSLLEFCKTYFYPRFGFAYTPFSTQNFVIRGAYGIYGNTLYGALSLTGGPFSGSESFTNHIVNGSPSFSFPRPFLSSGTVPTQNIRGVNPKLRVPYLQQWNLTIEKAIGTYALTASYVGSKATNLVYSRNLNQPRPSTTPFSQSQYTYPLFNSVLWSDNGGTEKYNSLQLSARKTFGQALFFKAGWTWAKDLTDTQDQTGYTGQVIQNAYDRAAEYGDSANVSRHRVFLNVIYDLPVGQSNKALRDLAADWSLALHFVGETGPYFTPQFSGFDPSNTNSFAGRPDVIPGVSETPPGGHKITQWFNPAAFKIPGCPDNQPICSRPLNIGRFGNARLDSLQAPNYIDLDTALTKNFKLGGAAHMQFRISAQNVLNHANFAPPASVDITSPTVGSITSTYAESAGSRARQVDLWVRISF